MFIKEKMIACGNCIFNSGLKILLLKRVDKNSVGVGRVDTVGHYYANMSMQYTVIFHGCKNDNFQINFFYIFSYFCSKHRLWVHLEPPQ